LFFDSRARISSKIFLESHLTSPHLIKNWGDFKITSPHPKKNWGDFKSPHLTSEKIEVISKSPHLTSEKLRRFQNHLTSPQKNRGDIRVTSPHLKKIEVILKSYHLTSPHLEVIYIPGTSDLFFHHGSLILFSQTETDLFRKPVQFWLGSRRWDFRIMIIKPKMRWNITAVQPRSAGKVANKHTFTVSALCPADRAQFSVIKRLQKLFINNRVMILKSHRRDPTQNWTGFLIRSVLVCEIKIRGP